MSVLYEDRRSRVDEPPAKRPRSRARPPINIQDSFLFGSLKEHQRVVVALLKGDLIQGRILRFDRYAIVVDDGTQESLIYKHAIACIARACA